VRQVVVAEVLLRKQMMTGAQEAAALQVDPPEAPEAAESAAKEAALLRLYY